MKELLRLIRSDLTFYGGSTFRKGLLTFLFKHTFRLMLNYRLGHYFFYKRRSLTNLFVVYLKYRQLKYSSCHLSYEASLGAFLDLPHPVGIVIGKGVIVKDHVTIYQNCTLGQKKEGEYPTLFEKSTIFPSSVVVGKITIGYGAVVGANSFVDKSVHDQVVFFNKIPG